MKKIAQIGAGLFAFFLPALAFAAQVGVVVSGGVGKSGGGGPQNIQSLGATIINLINTVFVPLIFALAFVVFLWGVFQYFILGGADDEKREAGKSLMIWGLIGFFVMVSVWGLINLLVGTFNLNDKVPVSFPTTPTIGK